MTNASFKTMIEDKISDNHLLKHSFYKAWNAGELKIETIQEYAAQYFNHVSANEFMFGTMSSNSGTSTIERLGTIKQFCISITKSAVDLRFILSKIYLFPLLEIQFCMIFSGILILCINCPRCLLI